MMKLILAGMIMAMVSCAPLVVEEPIKKREVVKKVKVVKRERAKVVAKPEVVEEVKKEKLLTGKVTFSGFSVEGLEEFRVIPEEGREVIVPENRRYPAVDGFWWRGDREKWFKIPDHAEAWVVSGAGEKSPHFDSSVMRGSFSVFWKTLPGFGWASALRGGVSEPGFYPNAGKSRIGVAWPF